VIFSKRTIGKRLLELQNIFDHKLFFTVTGIISGLLLFSVNSFAIHPLITDDTGTQGKGNVQIELNGGYTHDKDNGIEENVTGVASIFSYGIIGNVDIIFGIPYQFIHTEIDSQTSNEKGISDLSFEVKWRFFEIDVFGFGIKPGISFPTGNYEKGFGAGKICISTYFIMTANFEPVTLHLNLGYIRNENKLDEEQNIYHASLACEYMVIKYLRIVGNIGLERNTDKSSKIHPAFVLGGFIYSFNYNFDADAGFKYGLNSQEPDYSIIAGITIRF
jgi:hypothetical protein